MQILYYIMCVHLAYAQTRVDHAHRVHANGIGRLEFSVVSFFWHFCSCCCLAVSTSFRSFSLCFLSFSEVACDSGCIFANAQMSSHGSLCQVPSQIRKCLPVPFHGIESKEEGDSRQLKDILDKTVRTPLYCACYIQSLTSVSKGEVVFDTLKVYRWEGGKGWGPAEHAHRRQHQHHECVDWLKETAALRFLTTKQL